MKDTFIKFVKFNGDTYYVSVLDLFQYHQDTYQDDADKEHLYKWEDTDRGWQYVAIN